MAGMPGWGGSRRGRAVGVLAAAVLALAAGCGGGPGADETPPAPTTGPTSSAPPTVSPGLPATADKRVIGGFLSRPCDLLTSQQIAALDLINVEAQPREPVNDGGGPLVCTANRAIPGALPREHTEDITIFPADRLDVLNEAVYLSVSSPPTNLTVQGLPAVLVTDNLLYQLCRLSVRTAPGQGFNVFIGREDRRNISDACNEARAVGEAVTTNLPRHS